MAVEVVEAEVRGGPPNKAPLHCSGALLLQKGAGALEGCASCLTPSPVLEKCGKGLESDTRSLVPLHGMGRCLG